MAKPKHVSQMVVRSQVQQIAKGETPQVEKFAKKEVKTTKPSKAPIKVMKPKR